MKRDKVLHVMLSDLEKAKLAAKARGSGLTMAAWIREAIRESWRWNAEGGKR